MSPCQRHIWHVFGLWKGAKSLELAPKPHHTQTWTQEARLGGEVRTQTSLQCSRAEPQSTNHSQETFPLLPQWEEQNCVLTNARADEFSSPWLPSALSDGLPQLRCKWWQSHVNLTCETKNLRVFGEMAEGWDYEAQCEKNKCISQHWKARIKAAVLWEEGNMNREARNLHFT